MVWCSVLFFSDVFYPGIRSSCLQIVFIVFVSVSLSFKRDVAIGSIYHFPCGPQSAAFPAFGYDANEIFERIEQIVEYKEQFHFLSPMDGFVPDDVFGQLCAMTDKDEVEECKSHILLFRKPFGSEDNHRCRMSISKPVQHECTGLLNSMFLSSSLVTDFKEARID